MEELYDRYVKLVYSFAIKSLKDEQKARVIVQAVFMRLWTTEKGYDPGKGQFVNWLLTITRNITIDHVRKEKREQAAVAIEPKEWEQIPDAAENDPENIVTRKLAQERIKQSYRFLSQSQAELIHRLYWEGYSLSEIALMRNEPIGTIKSRLHQALKILRSHLVSEKEE